jgi:hypothetical protein
MHVRRNSFYATLAFASLFEATAAHKAVAQDAPEKPKPPIFGQLFQNPTGMNGYEDWVQASDLVQNNKLIEQATADGATLTMKRRLLAEPAVQSALHLLHVGLSKPAPPRLGLYADTRLPEYIPFLNLGHLLAIELYVQFADGRVDAAIDTLDDGLRFGYRMQADTRLSVLSGIVVATDVLEGFSPHLDQLSEYQCLRLRRMVEEITALPSPVALVLRGEQQERTRMFDRLGADPKGVENVLGSLSSNEEEWDEIKRDMAARLRRDPASLGVIANQAKAQLSTYYTDTIAGLNLPPLQRKPLPFPGRDTPGGQLLAMFVPTIGGFVSQHDESDARLRLLGVHAAIRAYRWEYNHLPLSLADLHIRDLALDPFTGAPLHYQNNGTTYDLFSRGPVSRGNASVR